MDSCEVLLINLKYVSHFPQRL